MGCVLLVAFIPFRMNGQYSLMVSGDGQLRMLPSTLDNNAGTTYYNFLPQYKPLTKSITITRYQLYYDDDLGNYTRCKSRYIGECDDVCCSTTDILYDKEGRIIKVSSCSFQYEDNRITEYQVREGNKCRFKYNSQNNLESATQGKWTYNYDLDKKGNITRVNVFFGAESRGVESGFQYDSNHKMIAFQDDYSDYHWNYDKDGNLISYRVIDYSFSKGKKGGKTGDHEYQFEYGDDGNPIRCIDYIHGDITVIDDMYEYEYTYVFFPDPKEQERLAEEKRINDSIIQENQKRVHDSIQRENQRRIDSIHKENLRRMDSIREEEQKQEKLRQERKREMLQPCKFLFNSDEEFVSCVMKENEAIEKEITSLIVKPLQVVYVGVANGKELRKESQAGRTELIQICEMCSQLKEMRTHYDGPEGEIVDHIYDYTESKLGDFVLGRSVLNKAYKKTSNSDYSSFLLSYMNGK